VILSAATAYLVAASEHQWSVGMVIAASVAFGLGGAFMKASDGFSRPWPSAAVIILFIVGAIVLAHAVRENGLSVAYTVGLGVEAVVSVVLGRYVFGERLSTGQLIGLMLILAGVASVRLG